MRHLPTSSTGGVERGAEKPMALRMRRLKADSIAVDVEIIHRPSAEVKCGTTTGAAVEIVFILWVFLLGLDDGEVCHRSGR